MAFASQFVLLNPQQHEVKSFDCGKPDMNVFLSRYADKNRKLGLSATWILTTQCPQDNLNKTAIGAYYTLASTAVSREQLPTDKNLPAYPVPVVLLARLAVNRCFQKQGLGEKTLVSALRQSVYLTDKGLPALGVVLDVLDGDALGFYQAFGMFRPFTDQPMRLFVPMEAIRGI
ncbi:GNAT family N-acetyltransferase [Methylovulum psychrotolerans]|uniref:GNAT family N-acetyltransferase n=1 Tax=Methylovulum psychrotolerans TaxID=1704499 RepID=A0A2S5CQJ9_9GAMM|nr:GNAT family N-acetyltransferase [Methylovulum psychrotolerans]POZ53100.1 GNAT family N-acetyltransferase [Methylovulum psychrotolerans]